ncbi:MAG: cobyrinate a,c-diamide synthase, partial [Nitrospinae bacterium]|nr:cobyrinate a,c-diamide synthase [Nitrospinota bacterium]
MGDFSSLVVAGTQSGVGKTSVSISLASALTKRGLVVQTFKCGPDFLDPTWLKSASGRNCYNLDGWMMGKEYVKNLYAKNSAGADVAVTEGVMGMFDSAGPGTIEGSTAEIALILNAPVLLVVDARGMAGSICAVVKGYADFKPGIKIAGVLANNVGSERHGKILADCLKAEGLPPMLGAVPKGAFVPLGSRHLGLVSATEKSGQIEAVNALAETAEKYFDLDGILKATRVNRAPVPALAACNTQRRGKIGIASDEAFNFYYRDNLEALENAGCEIVEFSPLGDAQIPEGVAALYFGGGYPEEHAERLGQNHAMIQSVRGFVAGNRPVYAECGGLIYLSQGIESA